MPIMDSSFESEILHRLRQMSPAARHAFVIHEDKVYFARDGGSKAHPSSPAVKLLQGLFEQHRDLSFFILRKRIFVSYEPGAMDRGFIDLVAKRFSQIESAPQIRPESRNNFESYSLIEVGDLQTDYLPLQDRDQDLLFSKTEIKSRQEALEGLAELEAQVIRGEVLHDVARPIGAILTSKQGKVLGFSVHNGAVNKTLHAEIILLQNLFIRGFHLDSEENYRLYVSITPCRMCAGAWSEVFGEKLRVYFRDIDPGTKARLTALERQSQQEQIRGD